MSKLETLKAEVKHFEDLYHAAVRAQDAAKFSWENAKRAYVREVSGVVEGDRVLHKGQEFVVSEFNLHIWNDGGVWLNGRPVLKDGSVGKSTRPLCGDWTKKPK